MNVLVVTTSYPTRAAPVSGVFVREHVEAVRPLCDVTVLHLERADVRRIEVEKDDDALRVRYPRRPASPWHLAAALRGLRLERGHDVVHAHFFLAGLPAVLFQRRPVVVSEHWSVFLPEDPMRLSRTAQRAAKIAFERAERVLPVSAALQRGIEAHGIRARFQVVPNVVDSTLFRPGDGPRAGLLAVGLLYEAKGFDILLDAVARLPGRELALVGDGPLRASLEAQVDRLGLRDRVVFHGALEKAEVARLMRAAEVVVAPSRFETSGVAAIEALVSGTPVVATAVGALPELLRDGGGTLARPEDPYDLARAIVQVLAAPPEMEDVAARVAERHAPSRIGREIVAVYHAVASGR